VCVCVCECVCVCVGVAHLKREFVLRNRRIRIIKELYVAQQQQRNGVVFKKRISDI
jgi:hypothetical protein